MATAKKTTATKKKATTEEKAKTAKAKSPRKAAQERLDKALETYDEEPVKEIVKKKRKLEDMELTEVIETVNTGKEIGEAAVANPVLGIAIAVSAIVKGWQIYQESKK